MALPFVIYKSRTPKYSQALPARFLLKNNPSFEKNGLWFHCCSFGETRAIKTIIDQCDDEINISVITNTGFDEAKKLTNNVRYLPYELFLPFWVKRQKVLVVMEAELWYMMFLSAFKKGTKTILINARISDRSYGSYKKFSWFYKRIFNHIDKIFAQSQTDKIRLEELGATNVEVVGNIKLSQLPEVTKKYEKPTAFTVTAGSTHKNEEELILNAYNDDIEKLIIVPRHPERFEEVHEMMHAFALKQGLRYHRFSQRKDFESDLILADVMGELNNIYAISDLVILGGAFEKIGGHNPVEPAFFNCRIISGEHIFNQKPLFECINEYTIVKNEELKDVLCKAKSLKSSSLKEIGNIEPIIKEINGIR